MNTRGRIKISGYLSSPRERTFETLDLGLAVVSLWAETEGTSPDRLALGVDAARVRLQARVDALRVDAGHRAVHAVGVPLATSLGTTLLRVSVVAVRAEADSAVIGDLALGSVAARLAVGARVDTLTAGAGQPGRAVGVGAASSNAKTISAEDALRAAGVGRALLAAHAVGACVATAAVGCLGALRQAQARLALATAERE